MRTSWFGLGCVLTTFAIAPFSQAQEFPSKPVTLQMPYSAGGPGDTITRVVGQGMSKVLGKPFVVENTAGAGGTLGTAKVASSPPDGHTLLVMHLGHATNTALYPNLRYDAIKDFEPIGLIVDSPMLFVAKKDFPPNNFAEYVAYIKANKTKVTYGHAGIGSASHLCGLLFFSAIDTPVTSVPYKGAAPATNDLLGGQFDIMCDQTLNVLPSVRDSRLKAYAVTPKQRLPVLPDLPTAHESGLPGFETNIWFAMWAPKDTPKPALDKLAMALNTALADPDVKKRLEDLGAVVVTGARAGPEPLRAHLKAEIDRWGPIIKAAGVHAQ
jgi:tripartite-type tricarboxylate transporter receptor subunit TctC